MSRQGIIANDLQGGSEPPKRIRVIPAGTSRRRSGETFVCNAEDAAAVLADFKRHGVELPIDVEHQTLGGQYASPDGKAPAVGWMSNLEWVEGKGEDEDGVWADVSWNAEGEELLRSKKYRYLSNVVRYDVDTRRVFALHSAALTNKPAIANVKALVNSEGMTDADRLDEIRTFLNLPKSATREEILAAFNAFLNQATGGDGSLLALPDGGDDEGGNSEAKTIVERNKNPKPARQVVTLPATNSEADTVTELEKLNAQIREMATVAGVAANSDAKTEDLVAAIKVKLSTAANSEAGDSKALRGEIESLRTSLTAANTELESLRTESNTRKVEERLAQAKTEGKANEAMLAANSDGYCFLRDIAGDDKRWDAWIKTAPVISPTPGRMVDTARKTAAGAGANDPIAANAEKFDSDAMPEYERVRKYQTEHKCGFEQALKACGGM